MDDDIIVKLARKKGLGVRDTAARAAAKSGLLALILKNMRSKNDTLRYNCYQVLLCVSESDPSALYPHWDALTEMLDSENRFFKYQAIYLIANLLSADAENRFEGIAQKYFGLIDSDSVMIASHLALNAGKIAKAKPELRPRIVRLLLNAGRKSAGHRNGELLCSYIIEALGSFNLDTDQTAGVRAFVQEQMKSGSPKTRKTAKGFLERIPTPAHPIP
jgi:hypothetical protein